MNCARDALSSDVAAKTKKSTAEPPAFDFGNEELIEISVPPARATRHPRNFWTYVLTGRPPIGRLAFPG